MSRKTITIISSMLLTFGVWGCNAQDQNKTVTVEMTGVPSSDLHREEIADELKKSVDDNIVNLTSYSSQYSNNKMTVRLSPVTDVNAFVSRIRFAPVTKVQGRTVYLQFGS